MKSKKGITLIELLAVILIVGILAAVAIPSYTGYMQRARRADAKTALEQVRAAQEMWRAERGCYALDGVDCQGNASAGTAEAKLQTAMGLRQQQLVLIIHGLLPIRLPLHLSHRRRQSQEDKQATGGYGSTIMV